MRYKRRVSAITFYAFSLLITTSVFAQEDITSLAVEPVQQNDVSEMPNEVAPPEDSAIDQPIHEEATSVDTQIVINNDIEDSELCAPEILQSPIDINTSNALTADLGDIEIDYKTIPLTILNNGHTVQVNLPEGSTMTIDGTEYHLLQFDFHTPSEHIINGAAFPMEIQFTHKSADGTLSALSVMIKEGAEHSEITKIWKRLPIQEEPAATYYDNALKPVNLLPENLKYYRFMGSLTTPPYTEGINWYVLETPIELSKEQIDRFKEIFPMNARPVQPLNNRLVVLDK